MDRNWTYVTDIPDNYHITDLKHYIQENQCTLTWKWPENIQYVLMVCTVDSPLEEEQQQESKVYTREEYKANKGYKIQLHNMGRYHIRVCAYRHIDAQKCVYDQQDDRNSIAFNWGKSIVKYAIKYGSTFLKKTKTTKIELYSEMFITKEILCYVKKEGSIPASIDDGISYPFIHDILPGMNKLPEIEIGKQDQIRIFLNNSKKYGHIFTLVPM